MKLYWMRSWYKLVRGVGVGFLVGCTGCVSGNGNPSLAVSDEGRTTRGYLDSSRLSDFFDNKHAMRYVRLRIGIEEGLLSGSLSSGKANEFLSRMDEIYLDGFVSAVESEHLDYIEDITGVLEGLRVLGAELGVLRTEFEGS